MLSSAGTVIVPISSLELFNYVNGKLLVNLGNIPQLTLQFKDITPNNWINPVFIGQIVTSFITLSISLFSIFVAYYSAHKQIKANFDLYNQKYNDKRRNTFIILQSDINVILDDIHVKEWIKTLEAYISLSGDNKLKISDYPILQICADTIFDTYDAQLNNISFLEPNQLIKILEFYHKLRSVIRNSEKLPKQAKDIANSYIDVNYDANMKAYNNEMRVYCMWILNELNNTIEIGKEIVSAK